MLLFLGDDWSEESHDVELQDEAGRVLARAKLPEGMAGMARLHAMVGRACRRRRGRHRAGGDRDRAGSRGCRR